MENKLKEQDLFKTQHVNDCERLKRRCEEFETGRQDFYYGYRHIVITNDEAISSEHIRIELLQPMKNRL